MLCSTVLKENLLGRKVCVEGNKYGIIKFYGKTLFADGLWCGIELNEAIGDNDGMVENIRYFTCKEKYGIFVPASEASIVNTPVSENYSDVLSSVEPMFSIDNDFKPHVRNELYHESSVLDDSQSVSSLQKNVLNESYTISKGCYEEKNLSIIIEENNESGNALDTNKFQSFSNLSKWEIMFSSDQSSKPTSATSENPEKEISDQEFDGNYDSDESLGILPDLENWDGLIYDNDEPHRDLNITVNLSNKYMGKFRECQNNEPKFSGEELIISPICNNPNISFYVKTDESPVYSNQNMPKCASTPKYESNFSYVIDEEVALKNTNVIETGLDSVLTNIPTSAHSESSENINLGQNICNVTCNIFKPLDNDETTLNKTFEKLDVLTDKCVLPTIISHIEPNTFNKLNVLDDSKKELTSEYSHFLPFINFEQCDAAAFDSNGSEENLLNVTCDLVNGNKILTKEPVSIESHIEPNLFNKLNVPDGSKEELTPEYSHFLPFMNFEQCDAAAFDSNGSEENLLNVTCDLVNGKKILTKEPVSIESHIEPNLFNKLNVPDGSKEELTPEYSYLLPVINSEQCDAAAFDSNGSEENLLNVTCDLVNGNKILNKEPVSIESHIEPNLFNKLDVPDGSKEELTPEYSHLLPLINSEQCDAAAFDSNGSKENLLNVTCDLGNGNNNLLKEPQANFPQIELVKGRTLLANSKSSATNVLNATLTYPQELGKTQQICFIGENEPEHLDINKNIVHCKTGDVLNTTYEKTDESNKSDTASETLKCITNLEENRKHTQILQLDTKNKSKKTVLSFADVALKKKEFRNKDSVFHKRKSIQKSVRCFDRTNVISAELNKITQKNSVVKSSSCSSVCTSSEVHETKSINHSSAESLLPKCSVDDSENKSYLIKKERLDDGNSDDLIKKTVKCSPLKSKLSEGKQEELKSVSKIELKDSQESLLNETINLPPLISDIGKTVVKKPRHSMQFSYPKENSLGLYKIPLCKNSKTANPSFQKKSSEETATAKEREITPKSNKAETFALSSKTVLKKPVALEKGKTISRLPQKYFPQSSSCSGIPSINTKSSSNIPRPWSTVSALKPPYTRGSGKPSSTRKPLSQRSNEFVPQASLNDTILISTDQGSKQSSVGSSKPSTTRGNGKPSVIPVNQGHEFAPKASLSDTVLISADRSSKEPSVESIKDPSIPQPSRQQVKKSSQGIPRRIGSSIPRPSRHNLR